MIATQVDWVEPGGFERSLTHAALGGAGWPEILNQVHQTTRRHCRLVGIDGAALATTDGGSGLDARTTASALSGCLPAVRATDGWHARALPAVAGEEVAGVLLMAEPASQHALELLGGAVTAILVESIRRSAARDPRYSEPADVIAALRAGIRDVALQVAAGRFGLELERPGYGAVLSYHGPRQRSWATSLAWLDRPVQHDWPLAWLVVTDGKELAALRGRLQAAVGSDLVRAASGSLVAPTDSYRVSFAEAGSLLAAAGDRSLAQFEDAGLLQLLLATPRSRVAWFVTRHLGPILDRPELVATLRAWLASDGSRQAVSVRLHLHRNSVGYRVGLLKNLLGVDPLEPRHAAVLHAALAAHDLLHADDGASATTG